MSIGIRPQSQIWVISPSSIMPLIPIEIRHLGNYITSYGSIWGVPDAPHFGVGGYSHYSPENPYPDTAPDFYRENKVDFENLPAALRVSISPTLYSCNPDKASGNM